MSAKQSIRLSGTSEVSSSSVSISLWSSSARSFAALKPSSPMMTLANNSAVFSGVSSIFTVIVSPEAFENVLFSSP